MIAVLAALVGLPLVEVNRPLAVVVIAAGLVATTVRQTRRWVP